MFDTKKKGQKKQQLTKDGNCPLSIRDSRRAEMGQKWGENSGGKLFFFLFVKIRSYYVSSV